MVTLIKMFLLLRLKRNKSWMKMKYSGTLKLVMTRNDRRVMFNGSVVMKGVIHRGNDKNTYNIETHLGLVCVPNRRTLIKIKNAKSPISYSSMPEYLVKKKHFSSIFPLGAKYQVLFMLTVGPKRQKCMQPYIHY